MNDQKSINFEWVCSEGNVNQYSKRVVNDGGKVINTDPFVPNPDETDLFSDAQFEPLIVVGIITSIIIVIRYIRELILDLKGREVAIIDLSMDIPQIRVIPIGKASQVIVKGNDGSVVRFSPSRIDDIEKDLNSRFQLS